MTAGANEALRFDRLRAQDGQPLLPPPSVQPLCRNGSLDLGKVDEARRQWQSARDQLQMAPSYPTEERLFWLAFLLARHYAEVGQRAQVPGVVEPILPLLQQARHQQVLLGTMARNAAAMGDLDGATRMVAQLDPASDDLQIDTNYRFSTAYVALLRDDARTVLSVLGHEIDDVPISDAYDNVCGVFRAHAHERLGNLDVAAAQLQRLAGSMKGLASVKKVVQLTPQISLLAQTLPRVEPMIRQLHENPVVTDSGINIARIALLPMFGIFGAIGVSGLASEFLDPPASEWVPGVVIAVVVVAIIGTTLSQVLKGPAQRRRLLAAGVQGVGQLMVVEQTGTRVNDQPMLKLRMVVTLPDQAPYSVVHHEVVPEIRLSQMQPGATLGVRVDPSDRRKMAVEWR